MPFAVRRIADCDASAMATLWLSVPFTVTAAEAMARALRDHRVKTEGETKAAAPIEQVEQQRPCTPHRYR